MALKSKKEQSTEETPVVETPNVDTTETVKETTEVATRPENVVAISTTKATAFVMDPEILEIVSDATYGDFPSVTAANGTHMCNKEDIGKELKFQAIIAKEKKIIAPGETGEEAKEYFEASEDGETVSDGRSLDEALQDAIDAGYEKATIRDYIDVIALVIECEDEDMIGETVVIQLAPSSQFSWRRLEKTTKMKALTGKVEAVPVMGDEKRGLAVVFTCTAKATSYKGNNYTKFEFSA